MKHVSNKEHVNILTVYTNRKIGQIKLSRGGSFKIEGKTIRLHARSPETISSHIYQHNQDVQKFGFCEKCWRERGSLENQIVKVKEMWWI